MWNCRGRSSPYPTLCPCQFLLPAPVVTSPSLLSVLFPPSLAFLSEPSPPLLASLHGVLSPLLSSPVSAASLPHVTRRLEPILADIVHQRYSHTDLVSPLDKDRARNEVWLEVMKAVQSWQAADDLQTVGQGRSSQVAEAICRWGVNAREAEEMEDFALARLHHENRITAATGWMVERGGERAQGVLVAVLYEYAGFACRRGETEFAEVSLRKALSLTPHTPSLLLLVLLMLEVGELREAYELMQDCTASHSEPLVAAVLTVLYHHMEEDALLAGVIASVNPTIAALSPTHPPSPLTAEALGDLALSQLGWSFDGSLHLSVLGMRYAYAMGLKGAAEVCVRAVIAAEEGRGIEEEKEAGKGDASNPIRYLAWLHLALLQVDQAQYSRAVESVGRVVRGFDLLSSAVVEEQSSLPPPVLMFALTRAARVLHACRRVEDCESLLVSYVALIPDHPALPLHLPSISQLTRIFLAKQNRGAALSLLSSLIPSQASTPTSPWLHLLYADALYADGQYDVALSQCSEASLQESSNSRVYGLLSPIHCRLWKVQQTQREKVEAAEQRHHRRSSASSSPFAPSLHLQSLLTCEQSHHQSALSHHQHFLQLTALIPLPVTAVTVALYLELGMAWYEREQWDQAEEVWRIADVVEGGLGGAGGLARERLEWVKAKRAGGVVEGESEARMIQGLFRRVKLKKDRSALEHKEVVRILHKKPGGRGGRPSMLASTSLSTARVRSLD